MHTTIAESMHTTPNSIQGLLKHGRGFLSIYHKTWVCSKYIKYVFLIGLNITNCCRPLRVLCKLHLCKHSTFYTIIKKIHTNKLCITDIIHTLQNLFSCLDYYNVASMWHSNTFEVGLFQLFSISYFQTDAIISGNAWSYVKCYVHTNCQITTFQELFRTGYEPGCYKIRIQDSWHLHRWSH